MKAVIYEAFSSPPHLADVPDPVPEPHGVVIKVMATGVCRSDWHGWKGHDPDIRLPHVPGHELAGVVEATGKDVRRWKAGDPVTVPFVCGCGECPECRTGNHQVCEAQFQPGFTHWGSFAQYVSIHRADINLVRLPDGLDFTTAASLGCRFVTSFRAIVERVLKSWAARSLQVGALATLVDVCVLLVCKKVLKLPTPVGAAIGVAVGSTIAFFLNRSFAFRAQGTPVTGQAVKFIISTSIAISIHVPLVSILIDWFGVPVVVAKFIADILVFSVGQLLVLRFLVFRKSHAQARHPQS